MDNKNVEVISKNSNYNVEEYKKKKREQLSKTYGLVESGIKKLKEEPNFLKSYLDIQSNFSSYTVRNAILIAVQNPNATLLKEYNYWKEQKVFFKNKFPKKVMLLEPKTRIKDGENIVSFNAKELIDISETNAKVNSRTYDKSSMFKALLSSTPVDIKAVDSLESGQDSEWNKEDNAIYVVKNSSPEVMIPRVASEIIKIVSSNEDKEFSNDDIKLATYMLCKKYNVPYSIDLPNIATSFKDEDKDGIIEKLSDIKIVFEEISNSMEQYLSNLEREQKSKGLEER